MKGVAAAVLCVAGLAYCAGQGSPPVDPMDHTVHLPHPNDCTMFLRCDHGTPKPEPCPSGLHFNPELQVCDWPNDAGCISGSDSTAPPPPPPPTNETGEGGGVFPVSDSGSGDSNGNSSELN